MMRPRVGVKGRPPGGSASPEPIPAALRGLARYVDVTVCGPELDVDGYVAAAPSRDLASAYPLLAVEDEERLDDPEIRERFIERIFAHARLRELFAGPWRTRDLIDFHRVHKLQLLAHDPARYREAGRVVATTAGRSRADVQADYGEVFHAALAVSATRGRHVNALQHAFGLVGEVLDDTGRERLAALIDDYQAGRTPLGPVLTHLAREAEAVGTTWVAEQTYLHPYPHCP